MYFLRRQSNPNFHPHLLHPALAHMLAQEEAMKCGSAAPKQQQRKMHCRASPKSNRTGRVEEKDHFFIVKDLPGVKAEDLTIEFDTHNGYLHVQGKRTRGSTEPYKFEHKFMVDEKLIDDSTISATLVDGVLEINVPKKIVTEEPHRVAVVAGAPSSNEEDSRKSHVSFTVDVPGIKIKALKVEIVNDTLSVTGERVHSSGGGASGVFNRAFALNTKRVDTNHLEAFLEDGVLMIRVPTKSPEAPRRIPVNGILTAEEEEKSPSIDQQSEKENEGENHQGDDAESFVDADMEESHAPSISLDKTAETKAKEEEDAVSNASTSSVASESDFEVVPETVVEDDE